MPFKSAVDPAFKRRFEAKENRDQAAILACIQQILENPRHPSLRSKKLGVGVWYSRATRAKRVTWDYGEERGMIVFRNHCDHDEVLRSPLG
jgi:hypothetical protein